MIEVEKEYYTVEMCRSNPKKLYVFGDNWEGVGKGGQACIRDEPNVIGISTKYSCMHSYSDKRMWDNISTIKIETDLVKSLEPHCDAIVFPAMGIGTGLASLQTVAPHTFIHLCKVLLDKFNFNNMAYLEPIR